MRDDRWCGLDIERHERDDGAAVRYAGRGRERRFRTSGAAKAAVDRAWPWPRPPSRTQSPRARLD